MKLSKKGEYALRALVALGNNHPRTMQIQEIAESENISKKFLEQVLLILRNGGYLQSHRGQHGGYSLRKKPDKIALGDILQKSTEKRTARIGYVLYNIIFKYSFPSLPPKKNSKTIVINK